LETYGLNPAASLFGNVIRLAGAGAPPQVVMATAGTTATMDSVAAMQVITTTMLWEAIGTPATDYTAYVHLVDAAGTR